MAKSLYNEMRPMNFDEFIGQDTRSLQRLLLRKEGRSFLITGPPGTGKTTLAGLIARSYLCDNPRGGSLLCGKCPTCTGDWQYLTESHPLINMHTVEDAATTKDILAAWVERSATQPTDGRMRKRHIFILDELQMLKPAPQTLSQLLAPLEADRERSVWILLSMDYGSLPEKPRQAIASRCHNVSLRLLPPGEIKRALLQDPNVSEEVAEAIACDAYSKGNMRRAWSLLEELILREESPLTVDVVHEVLGGGANAQERASFWRELGSRDRATQKAAIERLRSWRVEEETITSLLEEDLLHSLSGEAQREFCQALAWWYASVPRPSLWSLFLAFRGREVIRVQEEEATRKKEIPRVLLMGSIKEYMGR